MPRWASRINLEVIDIRAERLHDITEKDAKAEGARCMDIASGREDILEQYGSFVAHYKHIWIEYYGRESWEENPWVWAVEFKRFYDEVKPCLKAPKRRIKSSVLV